MEMKRSGSQVRNIQSVARAMEMMLFMGNAGKPLTLTEISRGLGLNMSTAHGILNTLKNFDMISQDPENDKYFLGFNLLRLGNKVPDALDLYRICRPYITELSEFYGDTVHIALLSNDEAVYIDKVEGKRAYRLTSRVGERRPLHCCSIGKAMLAFLSEKKLKPILERITLSAITPYTITSSEDFLQHLDMVRKLGYALDWEETEIGLCGAGAPILNHKSEVLAAISIAMPTNRFRKHGGDSIGEQIKKTAGLISSRMGYAASKHLPDSANAKKIA
jgi:DNA-binding IclR family transcriptional regulator